MLQSSHALPVVFEEAYKGAARVAFEARFDQKRNLDLGGLPGTATIDDVLDERLLLATRATVEDLGADFDSLKLLRPWALVFDLTPYLASSFEAAADQGVDKYLFERALRDQKLVEGLESIDFVPRRFNALGIDVQTEFLRQFIESKEAGRGRYLALVDAWLSGDVSAMEVMLDEQFGLFPKLTDFLLLQRNRNWLPRLLEYRKSKYSTLAVVGCFHLVGEGNLRQLLEQKGAHFEQL